MKETHPRAQLLFLKADNTEPLPVLLITLARTAGKLAFVLFSPKQIPLISIISLAFGLKQE